MKTPAKIVHIIIWSTLTLAGSNLDAAKEPLYDGLGSYSRKIATNSPEAQRYFDQGLAFPDEIAQTQTKFEKVWAADLTITTSCLCQPQA